MLIQIEIKQQQQREKMKQSERNTPQAQTENNKLIYEARNKILVVVNGMSLRFAGNVWVSCFFFVSLNHCRLSPKKKRHISSQTPCGEWCYFHSSISFIKFRGAKTFKQQQVINELDFNRLALDRQAQAIVSLTTQSIEIKHTWFSLKGWATNKTKKK